MPTSRFDWKTGVIIPMTTIQQLSLSNEVKSAVKKWRVFIYPVEDIYQACELLFGRDLLDENKDYTEKTDAFISSYSTSYWRDVPILNEKVLAFFAVS